MSNLSHLLELPFKDPVLIFFVILAIIFLCPLLLHRVKIPSIIGLIISGILIGPYGFNIIDNDAAIKFFSTIGLLYMMFIAGLELDMNEFSKNKNKSIIYSLLNFVAPPLLGFPLCYWGLGYSMTASMLLACMLMTHTLLSYPIVSKMRVNRDESVIITVGGTVLTDTVVLIILAIVMEYDNGITWGFLGTLLVTLILYLGLMFWSIPKLTSLFFRKLSNEGVMMYIYVLLIVFLASFLAHMARLEPIIGAFIAGLALNRQIPHSSVLMNRIDFVGNSLFIPIFLISVGMLVNLQVVFAGSETIILTVCLTIIALLSKWLVSYFARRIFRYSNAQGNLIFGLSTAHAAATLAIILVGYRAGALDDTALNATIILILITSIVATFTTEKAAKKVAIELKERELNELKTKINEEQHILLLVANPNAVPNLLEFAILLKEHENAYPITLLSVIPNNQDAELKQLKVRQSIQEAASTVNALETKIDIKTTISHNVPEAVSRVSKEQLSDTIILGWPKVAKALDKIIGELINNIIGSTEKMNVICKFKQPLTSHKRIVVIAPHYAELEEGFEKWLNLIARLSRELSARIIIRATSKTCEAVEKKLDELNLKLVLKNYVIETPENLQQFVERAKSDDLLCLINSREGHVSYHRSFEHLPEKIDKKFPNHSSMIIYPYQTEN